MVGGYAGFNDLYCTGKVTEVACMAHIRRKFVDVHKSQGSAIAEKAIKQIATFYSVEKEVRGQPPDKRVKPRQRKPKPIFDDIADHKITRIDELMPWRYAEASA